MSMRIMSTAPSNTFQVIALSSLIIVFKLISMVCATVRRVVWSQGMTSELPHEMMMTEFSPLDTDDMLAAYRSAKSRVLLFDYGGSLLEKEVGCSGCWRCFTH